MMLVVHDISALIITLFFGVHIYLTVFHPSERASFNAMATGYMDSEYAEHHHEIWYNEVQEQDEHNEQQLQPESKSYTV